MLDLFILSARTFPVAGRSENLFTEKATFLRFKRSVIDRFRFF